MGMENNKIFLAFGNPDIIKNKINVKFSKLLSLRKRAQSLLN